MNLAWLEIRFKVWFYSLIYLIFSAVNVSAVLPECLSQARVWIAEIEILML